MKNAIIVRTTVLTLFLSARAMANDRGDGIENHQVNKGDRFENLLPEKKALVKKMHAPI